MREMMKIKQVTALALAIMFIFTGASAQGDSPQAPPANDNFTNAQLLAGPSGSVSGTTAEATGEAGEGNGTNIGFGKTVWFSYTAPVNGAAHFNSFGSSFNTYMAVFTGSSLDSLTFIAGNNNTNGAQSSVSFAATQGETYKIVLGGLAIAGGGVDSGAYTLNYAFGATPQNDNFANAMNLGAGPNEQISGTNAGATEEAGEQQHGGNGTRSVWFRLQQSAVAGRSITVHTFGSNFNTTLAVYSGTTLANLTQLTSNDDFGGTQQSQVTFIAEANAVYYIAVDGAVSGGVTATGNIALKFDTSRFRYSSDFNKDGETDVAVFRPANGTWYYLRSNTPNWVSQIQWGTSNDAPVPGDYDGDGQTDVAVARNGGDGKKTWYVRQSFSQTLVGFQWGLTTDTPVPGDYDHDGRLDFAVYRPSNGTWYIRNSGQISVRVIAFGQSGDIPVPGGYQDASSTTYAAVFRPSNGTWYVSSITGTLLRAVQFGQNGDRPVPGDYDGDGRTDFAVFRPSDGMWYVLRSSDNQVQAQQLGSIVDTPQPADYDGDGKTDFALFRAGTRTWTILHSSDGQTRVEVFGLSSDLPASAPVMQ